MKQIGVFIICAALSYQMYAQSDTIKDPGVPKQVETSFEKNHPNAKQVNWIKEDQTYIASYKEHNVNQWTSYDNLGKLLENKWKIPVTELPFSAQNHARKNNTEGVQEYYKITNFKGVVSYEIATPSKEFFFDSAGALVKTVEPNK
ncbi:hypothetical protein [Cytophaga hutchinsonii]|jgi:hypothetical protein|uniref:Uncharacterized protein n=1 Tax=Cytophaga hutchinsonii (strain ATCC 33406 / DSM 1761 / CIP 103989 / NBRC 15051 / NCIMB 9469 / D465) TaxID=269798 RepID=A0A6N4SV68_CYTH3|nr:hypothetical protein [Cytophaga hutchinsonii]ABG60148.1 conserved hypothetical protein [Cytophaga hutchinsonii ATCC 33406]SFX23146.1 hypothetical protein SAMN04487930_102154 [Cytophaga hutchinsonii ATCC 33406]